MTYLFDLFLVSLNVLLVSYYVGLCSLFQTFNYETFITVLKSGLYLWPK